jgi:2-polyprenyl-6-methoxyphenol hydroxylase-like FAD-dependent oxidoreductase
MHRSRRALIVGGGIAGPALALFLARSRVEPIVFEARSREDDGGDGLRIAPNGMRVLSELGLAGPLLGNARPAQDLLFRNHSGRAIGAVRTAADGATANVGRALVHRTLRDAVERARIPMRYGRRLKDIAVERGEVVAVFEDGSAEAGDFLVGADGVHSRVRAWMLPGERTTRDTGIVMLGGFCAHDAAPPFDRRDAAGLTFIVGPSHQLGYSRMDDGRWTWWHAHPAEAAQRDSLLAMAPPALRDHLLARHSGWSEPVERLFRTTEVWHRVPVHDVPELARWRAGRVLLLGDAAHATSPAGGQGASRALEDAMFFATLASDSGRPIEDAMARFEALRKPGAEAMVARAYANNHRTLRATGVEPPPSDGRG